jgi:hypothetical protein
MAAERFSHSESNGRGRGGIVACDNKSAVHVEQQRRATAGLSPAVVADAGVSPQGVS